MNFNRLVLEQVAKDGTTYKSLAKEMALFILGKLPQEVPDKEIECYLCMRDAGENIDPDAINAAQEQDIPIVTYRPHVSKSGMRTYIIEIIPPGAL